MLRAMRGLPAALPAAKAYPPAAMLAAKTSTQGILYHEFVRSGLYPDRSWCKLVGNVYCTLAAFGRNGRSNSDTSLTFRWIEKKNNVPEQRA